MDMIFMILIALIILLLGWQFVLAPILARRGANPAMLQTVTLAIQRAVIFAERMYLKDNDIQRRVLAEEKIDELLNDMGVKPAPWRKQIKWLIDAAVGELPKTHPPADVPSGIECTE